jgi:uncharacterized protein YbbC (DUF1343 family)
MTHRLVSLGFLSFVCLAGTCAEGSASDAAVRPGIDVLLQDSVHLLTDHRVGLLTNQTGVDRTGVGDLNRLLDAGAQVTAIFSPEHGYHGVLNTSDIGHSVDSATGLPVFSLYGATRAPTEEMLALIDVMVIDLQDIGARPYTYISTVLYAMEACEAHGTPVIVLDRPNPIGGALVQGPVLDTALTSFIGMMPIPLRHGMTLGELALFGNDRLGIGANLTVIPAAGWARDTWFDSTGLPWVRPSPSMPDLESATHYPGTVIFEATNLSVGRGTPVAFQLVGAPWLDAPGVAALMAGLPGVDIRDTVVTPESPPDRKFDGEPVHAVKLRVTDRAMYDPALAAVALLAAVWQLHRDTLIVNERGLAIRIGTENVWSMVQSGGSARAIAAGWGEVLERFRTEREEYLLYR